MGSKTSIAIVLMALAIAGCTRSTNALNVNTRTPPQPLPSVPSGSAQTAELEPVTDPSLDPNAINPANPQDPLAAPVAPTAPTVEENQVEVASVETPPPANNEPLTHEPLAGSWNVASDSSQCRAILAFTRWSGGYRATTLRCNAPELKTVTAWDVKGPQVVLVDENGSQVASLRSVGNERYAGTTSSGSPITFSR